MKNEVLRLLDELNRTRTVSGSKKVIKKINKIVAPIIKKFYELELEYGVTFSDRETFEKSELLSFIKTNSLEVEHYFYNTETDELEIDTCYVCLSEPNYETHYLPMLALEDMDSLELNLKFKQSMLLQKDIRNGAYLLQGDINKWNETVESVEYLKTYDVLYLDPIDDKFKILQAWPAYCADKDFNSDIIWTWCGDDTTILSNERIYLKIKHYEKEMQNNIE